MQCPRGLEHGRDPGDCGRALRVRIEAGTVWSTDHRHATRLPRARRLRGNARQRRLSAASDDRAEQTPSRRLAGGGAARDAHARGPSSGPRGSAARQEDTRTQRDLHRRRRADGQDPGPRRARPRHYLRALPRSGRARHRQARQGRLLGDRPARDSAAPRHQAARRHRRHDGGLRQHHRPRGERPGLRLPRARGLRGILLPRISGHGPEDDQGPGRHIRLGFELRHGDRSAGGVKRTADVNRRAARSRAMSTMTTTARGSQRFWVPGDWNAFFGFGTNILVNLLVLTGLLRFVLKMPDELVFGRILPATGLMLFLSTVYYAWLAYRLAQKTGRTDVCALPSGVSVPHMFVVTFVVMLPILIKTNDPVQAWEAGLTWVFVQSFVLMVGGFIAPVIRRITPRAALLGSLAGISITFISMRPGLMIFETPLIGIVCLAIILANWFGGVRYFGGVPGGLIAIAAGTIIAWGSNIFGLGYGGLSYGAVGEALSHFGFSFPIPAVDHVFSGFKFLGVILVTAIPFGIYDHVEAMDNVESASAAGDSFPTTQVLTADGVISLIGCCLGNPFINAVYIGHPGWKAMGGRIGYSAATGVMVLVLSWLGIVALASSLIPVIAILPILLYIGMLIGSQAFQETPRSHAPAIILAMIPQIAAWGKSQIDGALGAAGTNATTVGFDKLGNTGVLYKGLETLGGGATLAGIILGAVTVFIIERELEKAAAFALAGSILTFFGLIHAEDLGIAQSPMVSLSYACIAVMLYCFAKFAHVAPATQSELHGHGEMSGQPAE